MTIIHVKKIIKNHLKCIIWVRRMWISFWVTILWLHCIFTNMSKSMLISFWILMQHKLTCLILLTQGVLCDYFCCFCMLVVGPSVYIHGKSLVGQKGRSDERKHSSVSSEPCHKLSIYNHACLSCFAGASRVC